MPTAYSPALIYFGRERGWWITCNYPAVLKEKNINMNSPDDFIIYFRLHKIIKLLLLFILGGKEVGGLLVIILQF